MAELPVREMLLYKHGVGFFLRQGEVSGEEVTLTFKKDEINDVLKSLAVFDAAGGQIKGIHYQTPMDKAARLASSSINLSQRESMRDLIRDLRGRQATLIVETTPGTQETLTGRIIGMDEEQRESISPARLFVAMLTDDEQVRLFPFEALRSVTIHDEQSAHDLSYFLDTGMAEDERRHVTLRLTEGEHDLRVYYVAPSPTWRVSYRLVAESDETGKTGKALLQGWGLFDNRLDEDLNDVRVTLVAGQPISFIYELYASRIPERPVVEDESRVAPGPIEFAGAMPPLEQRKRRLDDAPEWLSAQVGAAFEQSSVVEEQWSMADISQSTQITTETKVTGETFQYIVTNPVTVKRGESALVPIISNEIEYERELLYNREKLPDFPVAALRFKNDSDLTLERGPVTLVEDGDYRGEAVIPFTREHNEVYVTYAVERGIRISETDKPLEHRMLRMSIKDEFLYMEEVRTQTRVYSINNTTSKSQTITIERQTIGVSDWILHDTLLPDVTVQNAMRWNVAVDSGQTREFTVKFQRIVSHNVQVQNLYYSQLETYLKDNLLSQSLFDNLQHILDMIGQVKILKNRIREVEQEKEKIYSTQENIRKNLGALQSTGQEATLRNRLLTQLESTQDRLDEIATLIERNTQEIAAKEAQIREEIAALSNNNGE
ncbi:MAG: hypothetical protein ACPG7F_12805 [Aggregatilineales bacterium]